MQRVCCVVEWKILFDLKRCTPQNREPSSEFPIMNADVLTIIIGCCTWRYAWQTQKRI